MYQIRNSMSTDLSQYYDKDKEKLYVNCSLGTPAFITIEFIPRYDNVSDITSDYWIDVLMQLSVANAKIGVGRIRSRYQQTNALVTQDGERILEEGITELNNLRTYLQENYNNLLPID